MITIRRHQKPIACVRTGKGQPRFDCGRQVLQLTQRSMGYRQAHLVCYCKRIVETTKPESEVLQLPYKKKIYLCLHVYSRIVSKAYNTAFRRTCVNNEE